MGSTKSTTVWIVALVLVVVALLLGTLRKVSNGGDGLAGTADRLSEARKKIEELGYILDPAALRTSLHVPSNENAGLIYSEIQHHFYSTGSIGYFKDAEDPRAAALEAHENNPEIYEQLKTAAALPGCDFDRNWSEGPKLIYPELSQMKVMVLYCLNLAKESADRGRYDKALEQLLVADGIGYHAGSEPTVYSLYAAISCRAITQSAVADILIERPVDSDVVQLVRSYLLQSVRLPDYKRVLQGEVTFSTIALRNYSARDFNDYAAGLDSAVPSDRVISQVEREAAEALLLEAYAELHSDWLSAVGFSGSYLMAKYFVESHRNDDQPAGEYKAALIPDLEQVVRANEKLVVFATALRMLADVLEMARTSGLDAAIAAEIDKNLNRSVDTFLSGRYTVARVSGGFKVYSPGFDGNDDGGPDKIGYSTGDGMNDDIGFWIPLGDD